MKGYAKHLALQCLDSLESAVILSEGQGFGISFPAREAE